MVDLQSVGSLLLLAVLSGNVAETNITVRSDCEIDVLEPSLLNLRNNDWYYSAGSTYYFATEVTNYCKEQQEVIAIVEIRDRDYVTLILGLQDALIEPNDQEHVGFNWRFEAEGEYELRAFVISNFTNPVVLTQVHSSYIDVRPESFQPG